MDAAIARRTWRLEVTGPLAATAARLSAAVDELLEDGAGEGPDPAWPLSIGVFDLCDAAAQLAAEASARLAGRHALRIAVDSDAAWVGPLVEPGGRGCSQCANLWMRSRWTGAIRDHRPAVRDEALAWPAVFYELLANAVLAWLDPSGAEDPERRPPSREMLQVRLSPFSVTRHALAPHPDCEACGGMRADSAEHAAIVVRPRPKLEPRNYRASPRRIDGALFDRYLVDERTGVVKTRNENRSPNAMPLQLAWIFREGDGGMTDGIGRTGVIGSSRDVAVLEALERFSGFAPRGKRTSVRASFRELGDDAIDPRSFILHAEAQLSEPGFQLERYTPDLVCNWVWAWSFVRRRPVLIPEQLAYYWLPNNPARPHNRFVSEISNGCALGGSWEEAALYGLYEVIERDAFLTRWLARLPPERLDLDAVDDRFIRGLLAQADAAGVELQAFDCGVGFKVPAIAALLVDRRADTGLASLMTAGAHHDPVSALRGALTETITSHPPNAAGDVAAIRKRSLELMNDPFQVRTVSDHIRAYGTPESLERLGFWSAGNGPFRIEERFPDWYRQEPPADLTEDLLTTVEDVLQVASDVLVVDQTSDLLGDFGLSAVKVLAPGLHTVSFGHVYRRWSLERVNRAIEMLGAGPPMTADELNPHPHNFP